MPCKVGFRVIQLTGQDENFKGTELQVHCPTAKGWQSSRCCLYPQDIIIQLEKRTRMKKIQILSHQHLIATKIEFYVGDVPDGYTVSLENARYTRLGYVALSDNEKTSFKARELKSVHVDAIGHFVKFVIHKNHLNPHNLYNQVGLVAINVIGDDIGFMYEVQNSEYEENRPNQAALPKDRHDFISPFDDLAFDMYQDPDVAQIIRKLDSKKQEAVANEHYDYAKNIKAIMQQLSKVGEKLGKFEIEKRQAVENEDYDKAKLKKEQMDKYRQLMYEQLEVENIVDLSLPKSLPSEVENLNIQTPGRIRPAEISDLDFVSPPLPPPPDLSLPMSSPQPRKLGAHEAYDERPLPAMKRLMDMNAGDDDTGQPDDSIESAEPEPMSESDLREAGSMTDIFGPHLTSKVYSKHWNLREEALIEIHRQMATLDPVQAKDDARAYVRAALIAVNKSVRDNVFSVFTCAINLHRMILSDFVPKHRIMKGDTSYFIERSIPNLLLKTGDVSSRHRDAAKALIIEESGLEEVKSVGGLLNECLRPFKPSTAPRLALSRTEIVDMLYHEHGLSSVGLNLDNLMPFLTGALSHTSGDVREKAEKVIVSLYGKCGSAVKNYLPTDDEKTRKILTYKQLFKEFDKIDSSLTPDDIRRQKLDAEQQMKDGAHAKVKDDGKTRFKDKKEKRGRLSPAKPPKDDAEVVDKTNHGLENKCIFCDEVNPNFNQKGLDIHYWKSCPMLTKCSLCKQVAEISGLNEHLLEDCEHKSEFVRCQRCGQATQGKELSRHLAENHCVSVERGKAQCPLCRAIFPNEEDAWKNHLTGRDGCSQNPRRIQSHGGIKAVQKTTSRGKVK